jgi:hypothetical protein
MDVDDYGIQIQKGRLKGRTSEGWRVYNRVYISQSVREREKDGRKGAKMKLCGVL